MNQPDHVNAFFANGSQVN